MKIKKAVCLASVASNLDHFNRNNVKILKKLGYDVTLASNFHTTEDSSSQEEIDTFIHEMGAEGVHIVQIDFSRRIGKVGEQIKSYRQVQKLFAQGFDLIHCHTPICAAITRMCARKYRQIGTQVIYTAHGFHFYDGAPLKNWLVYYPIEKWLSKYTDILITINKEDYKRAKENFSAKKTVYIPGVGIDTEKFETSNADRTEKRNELNIPQNAKLLISVGELSINKNHKLVIQALNEINNSNLYYIVVGKGKLKDTLEQLDTTGRLKLLGYRTDIADLLHAADVFIFPSLREGLPVALMEAMAAGIPCACSRIRGNTDLVDDNIGFLFVPNSVESVSKAIKSALLDNNRHRINLMKEKIERYNSSRINETMENLYSLTI